MDAKEYVDRLRDEMTNQKNPSFSAEYIEKCCGYAKRLLDQKLPVLFDRQHIESALRLRGIQQDYYHEFYIPKSNGNRVIVAPSRPLKVRQQWIYRNILLNQQCSEYAHGFVSGHSIVSNATLHIGYLYTLCIDIVDFFPSINRERINAVFKDMGYSDSASDKLGSLCSHSNVLPQGAPTSPYLSNIICRKLDEELGALAKEYGCIFSRYADDMTFSANHEIMKILPYVENILLKHGFLLNRNKCRAYGPLQPKHITGLVVQESVHVPKAYKRQLRQEIYFCKKFGVTTHLENIHATKRIHFKEYLYGKAYFIKMVEPKLGQYFLDELSVIEWQE